MKNHPKSWKAVLDQRRKENFIGRAEYLRVFSENFTREVPEYMVFSVTGEGGVGKSTLLLQFANIARSPNNAIIITSDDRHASPAQAMGHVASELAKLDINHKEFDDRYKKYRELREEIESDPKAPRGAIDLLARGVTDFAIKSARKLPGASPFLEGLDEKAAGETFSQLINYGITKWGNKDEVLLLRETDRVLTPLFLDLLAKAYEKQRLVLMFDVFERTNQSLAPWLLQLFNFEFGEFDTNLSFVIAGRDPLEQHWTELASSICHIALEPFTLDETRLYLVNQEVTDDQLAVQIYDDTGGLPVLVQLLAATKPQPGTPLADVSKDAVERFLQWIPQEDRRRVALLAALPRQFNRDILTAALGDDATTAFSWLSMQSFVRRDTERGWFYHEKVRELMLRHLRNTTPKELHEAHFRLAEYFVKEQTHLNLEVDVAYDNGVWRKVECERVYHVISTQPERNKSEAINAFLHAFRFRWKFAATIARACKQVGREKGSKSFSDFADVLAGFYSAYDNDNYQVAIDKLNLLETQNGLTTMAKCAIFSRRGYLYSKVEKNDQAIVNLNQAIELDQKYATAIENRGMTYRSMSKYEEALADFDHVIELGETSAWSFVNRGLIYLFMGKREEAMADFDQAVEIDQKIPSVLLVRGLLLQEMNRCGDALNDVNRAIELDCNSPDIISGRGVVYMMQDKPEEALADFNQAIELDDTFVEAVANRGLIYRSMGRYKESLADFSRVIELDEKSAEAFVDRAVTYQFMERYEESLADFNSAIELNDKSAQIIAKRGETYGMMERYEEALSDLGRAIELDGKFTGAKVNRGITYRLMERYEEALTDFNDVTRAKPKNARAIVERGIVYRQMGRNKQALSEFSRAIEIDGKYVAAVVNRGESYRLMAKYEKALQDFNRAVELDEKDAYAIARRGVTYRAMARHKESLADLDNAIKLDEKYGWAIGNRGKTYSGMGRFEEALADLNVAIELDASLTWAYEERGVTYRLLGDFENALINFDSAIELDVDSKNGVAMAWRGEMKRRFGKYEEAINDLSTALKAEPKDNFSLSRRAAAYLATGRDKAAQRDFSGIMVTTPKNVADYYNRSVAFVLFQRYIEAIKVLKEAFRLDPTAYFYAITDDLIDPIRNMPEFQGLLDAMHTRWESDRMIANSMKNSVPYKGRSF